MIEIYLENTEKLFKKKAMVCIPVPVGKQIIFSIEIDDVG